MDSNQSQNADTKAGEGNTDTAATKTADTKVENATAAPADTQQTKAEATKTETDGKGDTAKPAEDGKAQGDTEADKTKDVKKAPEVYEFKVPEGATLDDAVKGKFSEVAKELDLDQASAQKVLDTMIPAISGRVDAMKSEWLKQSSEDKEFGGVNFEANLAVVAKARDAFANKELRELLDKTGIGNHPEVVRWFYRAGKTISEDKMLTNDRTSSGGTADVAATLYPSMKKSA